MLSFTLCIVRVVQPGQLGHYVSSTPSASIAVTELVLSMISPSFAAVLLGSLLSLRAVCCECTSQSALYGIYVLRIPTLQLVSLSLGASKERVLLENVSEFRVELGKMTTGRKSSQVPQVQQGALCASPSLLICCPLFPPPFLSYHSSLTPHFPLQLKCVGGTAGCAYTQQPRVVHCLNTGIETVQVSRPVLALLSHFHPPSLFLLSSPAPSLPLSPPFPLP